MSTPDLLKVADNSIWVPNLVPIYDVSFLPRFEDSLRKDSIKICQSPTRKFHKHTDVFKSVIANLSRKYANIEEVIIEKIPHIDCLQLKRRCNIIFDHMRGWFGISSLESLSQGKPVIAGLDDLNIKCIKEFTGADSIPWIIARSPETLYREIGLLIEDSDKRYSLGMASRRFMEKFWSEKDVLNILLSIYNKL